MKGQLITAPTRNWRHRAPQKNLSEMRNSSPQKNPGKKPPTSCSRKPLPPILKKQQ
jgi:hypothetical protein